MVSIWLLLYSIFMTCRVIPMFAGHPYDCFSWDWICTCVSLCIAYTIDSRGEAQSINGLGRQRMHRIPVYRLAGRKKYFLHKNLKKWENKRSRRNEVMKMRLWRYNVLLLKYIRINNIIVEKAISLYII